MSTSFFPRYAGDASGNFIFDLAEEVLKSHYSERLVVPGDPGMPKYKKKKGVEVHRCFYMFPLSLQSLAQDSLIPTNLKKSTLAKFQILPSSRF